MATSNYIFMSTNWRVSEQRNLTAVITEPSSLYLNAINAEGFLIQQCPVPALPNLPRDLLPFFLHNHLYLCSGTDTLRVEGYPFCRFNDLKSTNKSLLNVADRRAQE